MINDISAATYDLDMATVVAQAHLPLVIMHMRGKPENMMAQKNLRYDNLVTDILRFFQKRIRELAGAGVKDLLIDPGFGFSKSTEQNYQLLRNLYQFKILGFPLFVGLSRKSMIRKITESTIEEALFGSLSAQLIAALQGAAIIRVHDVKPMTDVLAIAKACYAR